MHPRAQDFPLDQAVYKGDVASVERLLKEGEKQLLNYHGQYPIHHMIANPSWELIKLLYQYDPDCIHQRIDNKGLPFFLLAAQRFSSDLFNQLCEEILKSPSLKETSAGQKFAYLARFALALPSLKNNKIILVAAAAGCLDGLKRLKDKGVDLTAQDNSGRTVAQWAARNGHLAVLQWLKDAGVSLTVRSNNGSNIVLEAAGNGHLAVLKWLKGEKNIDFKAKNNVGRNVVLAAARNGHVAVLQWLRAEKDVDFKAQDNAGHNAFFLAVRIGHLAVLRWLKDAGFRVVTGSDVPSAVLLAADCSQLEVLQLMKDEWHMNLSNQWDEMFTNALKSGHANVLKWLISNMPLTFFQNNPALVQQLLSLREQPHFSISALIDVLSAFFTSDWMSLDRLSEGLNCINSGDFYAHKKEFSSMYESLYNAYRLKTTHTPDFQTVLLTHYSHFNCQQAFEFELSITEEENQPDFFFSQVERYTDYLEEVSKKPEEEKDLYNAYADCLAKALFHSVNCLVTGRAVKIETVEECKSSPLAANKIAYLSENHRNALQAYYWLKQYDAVQDKKEVVDAIRMLNQMLSPTFTVVNSEETWNDRLALLYAAYAEYMKTGPDSILINKYVQMASRIREVPANSWAALHLFASSSNEAVSSSSSDLGKSPSKQP